MIQWYLFFCLLLIYSLMLCFWRYKVLLYPYTTQFLNYAISLQMKYYFFYDTLHLCSSTRPSFLCKFISVSVSSFFQIYARFFFWHMKKIYLVCFHISHIDPKDQKCKHFFWHTFRTTESSPVFCVCV